jgi:antitoxin component YwqK of YwqJK toxin-antitoxin module
MKYALSLIFILFAFIYGCQKQAPVSADLSQYEISNISGIDLQRAVLNNSDNQTIESGYIKNNTKEGQWIYYDTKGERIMKTENYVHGKLQGITLEFNERFELIKRTNYDNGQPNGYFATYNRSRVKSEGYYKAGKYHGRYTKYYDYSDQIQAETDYQNGLQHGIYRFYDKQGNMTLDYEYKDGEKVKGGMVN